MKISTSYYFLFFGLIVSLFAFACGTKKPAAQKVTLSGNFTTLNSDTLYLFTENLTPRAQPDTSAEMALRIDTIILNKGKFTLNKQIDEPAHFALFLTKNDKPVRVLGAFFLSEGTTTIGSTDTMLNDITIQGQAEQKVYEKYIEKIKPLYRKRDSLTQMYQMLNYQAQMSGMKKLPADFEAKILQLGEEIGALVSEQDIIDSTFIAANKKSYVSAWIVNMEFKERRLSGDKLKRAIASLDKSLQNSAFIGQINAIEKQTADASGTGAMAPDFSQPTPDGKIVSLSSFRGKIVVLDFWASWCGPCRRVNPTLVKFYEKYKDKGVEFLSVSLDESKDAWLKAIKDDKLTWTQVSDLKEWKNEAAALYKVDAIPATFLIDKDGKLLGHVEGHALDKRLDALLEKK